MQTKEAYLALIHTIILLLFLGLGFFFIGLYFAPDLRYQIGKAVLYEETFLLFVGATLLTLTVLLAIAFYGLHKKASLRLRMERHPAYIDSNIIKGYVESFWSKEYPERVKNLDVIILADQKVEISVQVRSMEEEEKILFLEHSEREIGMILSKMLDYHQDFFLTLHV